MLVPLYEWQPVQSLQKPIEASNSAVENGSITKEYERSEKLCCRLNNSHQYLQPVSVLCQHAEHATVLHGDRTGGAAGRRVPVSEAGDAEERQHVWVRAGVNFRGASHKPSQGKNEIVSVVFRYFCVEENTKLHSQIWQFSVYIMKIELLLYFFQRYTLPKLYS